MCYYWLGLIRRDRCVGCMSRDRRRQCRGQLRWQTVRGKKEFFPCLPLLQYHTTERSMSEKWTFHRGGKGSRTLSRILWKSKTLRLGILQASHSRYHFFSRTGFPSKERYWRPFTSFSGSRSPSSPTLLFVRTRVVRFGTERCKEDEMDAIRLFASSSVRSRRSRGMFPRTLIELSVKSMASCWS